MDYAEVILRVTAGDEEAAEAALLELGAAGTSRDCGAPESSIGGDFVPPALALRPEPDGPVEVVGYFSSEAVPDRARVAACFASLQGATGGERSASPEVLVRFRPIRDWATETRRSFTPFEPLPGLTVAPPWELPTRADGALIVLTPGAAFGLGTHATTRACLALMPPAPRELASALDVGTGTGILAIRAAQLGYEPVIGCDIDPIAAQSARENVAANGLAERVGILAGTLAAVRADRRFALVLANLLLNPLLELADLLAAHLAPEGCLIASGLLASDAPALIERCRQAGLKLQTERLDEPWAALRFVPGPPHAGLDAPGGGTR